MPVISGVHMSQLEGGRRIDPEYYRPAYLQLEQVLLQHKPRRLGQLIDSVKSFGAYSLTNQITYRESGIPFVRCIDVKTGYVDFSNVLRIDEAAHALLWKSEVKPGQVLLAMSGSVGNAAVAGVNWTYPINSNQDIAKITPKDFVDPYFLAAFLNSKYGRFQTERLPVGSIQQHIFLWQISLILVPLLERVQPAISKLAREAEQRLLASDKWFEEAETQLLSELGFLDWLPTHTLTFAQRLRDVVQMLRIDAEHFQPKYTQLRQRIRSYPYGYSPLLSLAVNSAETVEPSVHPDQQFDYIELANINQSIGVIEEANHILGKDAPSRARMLLRSGDVIASSVEGSLDKVALVTEEFHGAIGSTGFFVLRPQGVESAYVLALVKSPVVREQMRCEASGTILAAVPAKSLGRILIPNLPTTKQAEISALVQKSHAARSEAKALFEEARRAVEIAVENGEDTTLAHLNSKLPQLLS